MNLFSSLAASSMLVASAAFAQVPSAPDTIQITKKAIPAKSDTTTGKPAEVNSVPSTQAPVRQPSGGTSGIRTLKQNVNAAQDAFMKLVGSGKKNVPPNVDEARKDTSNKNDSVNTDAVKKIDHVK